MATKKAPEQFKLETILQKNMDDIMHESIMPYAEHVILERALPRVEDGLKPGQRRILFSMLELGLSPDKTHRKSARIVGDCLGKYHPHGDSSVYDAMVRMAQPFNMRLPLVDGHGNFGSIDGDSAAAMRYTEARVTPAAMQLLRDIDKDTVSFSFNFDDTLKEPDLLPGRFPNLLVNGATGIAVGLATNIPPHNPCEVIDAVITVMDNPRITLPDLMKILPAPDFPTGGFLLESEEIYHAYQSGRGKLTMRARTHFEDGRNGKTLIVITEFPYQINKAAALEKILAVSQEKKMLFSGIADIRDESDRQGMRAVIEIKKDAEPEKILQYLFKYSDLQCTFGVNMVAIAADKPQQMGLKQLIAHYIRHQQDVVTRRTKFELETALRREHILEGLMIAVDKLDEVIRLIRKSKSPREAKEALIKSFSLSDLQAQAILDLRLQRLTNMELRLIEQEYSSVRKLIEELRAILASPRKLINLIKRELQEIKKTMVTPRRTQLILAEPEIAIDAEDLSVVDDITVAICEGLKVRRCPTRLFSPAHITEDRPLAIVETQSNRDIRLFTDSGSMLILPACDIPETRQSTRAVNLAAILPFEKNERIVAAFSDNDDGDYLFFTSQGIVKRTPKSDYRLRVKRTQAIVLKNGDRLLHTENAENESILILSQNGMGIRFAGNSIPSMGRVSSGVKCMKLDQNDQVLFATQTDDEGYILLVSDKGYGKRSPLFDFELQGRNGKGMKVFDFKKNGANGTVLTVAMCVRNPFEFSLVQRHGTKTRFSTDNVHVETRTGRGSMLVAVVLDDDVIGIEK